ncbi:MAG: DUF4388 domain-containing protein, partial [Archangium sp.]|nr:DUF4388 domain-containing protein [Archangium sp.]
MFPPRADVLKQREGSLDDTPFPLLLHAIASLGRTCTLEVKLRNLEKELVFEDGALIGCESNLRHETLGAWLIAKGRLSEAQHHQLFSEGVAQDKPLGALLVERKVLSAFELFKLLQANLAQRTLDVFRWVGARWRVTDAFEVETPIRMNTTRLIFAGVSQLADAVLVRHFPVAEHQALALNPRVPAGADVLKLSAKELRLWNQLRARPTLAALVSTPGFTREEVQRRIFAWAVLDMVDLAERVKPDAPAAPTPPTITAEIQLPPVVEGLPFFDDDTEAMNSLASEYLTLRGKDAFALLGVPEVFDPAVFQRAFLAKATALPPARFKGSDSRSKAEALLVAYARAFGTVIEFESFERLRKSKAAPASTPSAAAVPKTRGSGLFRIRTELLDADAQFKEGHQRLEAGNFRGAVEYFEYACDIEPRGRFLAFLAWAR